MGLFSGLLGGLGSALGGALFGGDDGSDVAASIAKANADAGLASSLQGSNTPPPNQVAQSFSSGSQAQDLLREGVSTLLTSAKDAATGGLSSIIEDKITGGAGKQGRNAREYLDQAFPELNAWEKAGAGASGVGVQSAEMQNATKLKKMELDAAIKMKKMDNDTSVKTTQMNNDTLVRNTDANLQPVFAKLGSELNKLTAEISQIKASTSLTDAQQQIAIKAKVTEIAKANNLDAQSVLAAAQANAANTSRSVAGGIAHDVDYWGNELTDRASKLGSKVWDGVKSFGSDLKADAERWKQKKKLTITVNPKL